MKSRFLESSFNIRKWRTNNRELKEIINESEQVIYQQENFVQSGDKVLGIKWDEEKDQLILDIINPILESMSSDNVTKRTILKTLASIYDPMGYLQPVLVKFKILFQAICKTNIGWDEIIGGDLLSRWLNIVTSVQNMNEIIIDRCYSIIEINDPVTSRILHGFSDASELAYGACIYLKTVKQSGNVDVCLVTSKSRVVSINKKYTIPRLELLGNYVLSKLFNVVSSALQEEICIDSHRLWSDSKVSLAWINAFDKELKTFCQNRVIEIRKLTDVVWWSYCKSCDNPADIITRCNSSNICKNSMWWNGPKFLFEDSIYDETKYSLNENTGNVCLQSSEGDSLNIDSSLFYDEIKNENILMLNYTENNVKIGNIIEIEKFSDINKLLRVTSYVVRFVKNVRRKINGENLLLSKHATSEEIKSSKLLWLKENQNYLINESNFDDLKKVLCLQQDDEGLFRSMKRIMNADLPYDTRAPTILSRKHRLTELIVWNCHKAVKHMGVRQTLTELRSNFWITKGRSYVKNLMRNCFKCKKYNARPYSYPDSPNLPSVRLRSDIPFSGVGIDYLGPLYCMNIYNRVNEMFKCYVVLYTCASTRGVVLDLIHNETAKTFINSLTRFIARRGCPAVVLSDNGSYFVATETQQFVASKNIEWKFNLASAPWYGGFWERLVSSVKRCLKQTVNKSRLSYDELQTVLLEIENVLNSRPLCYLYDDDQDDILTPNHLLYGKKLDVDNVNSDICVNNLNFREENLTKRKQYLSTVLQHFWRRWSQEYVTSLREYSHATKNTGTSVPNVGDVVIVFDDKQPRQLWKLGRIVELVKSRDDEIRGAKVKLSKTKNIIGRPVNRLYPVEVFINAKKDDDQTNEIVHEIEDVINNNDDEELDNSKYVKKRSRRREAAVLGEIKRRILLNE